MPALTTFGQDQAIDHVHNDVSIGVIDQRRPIDLIRVLQAFAVVELHPRKLGACRSHTILQVQEVMIKCLYIYIG